MRYDLSFCIGHVAARTLCATLQVWSGSSGYRNMLLRLSSYSTFSNCISSLPPGFLWTSALRSLSERYEFSEQRIALLNVFSAGFSIYRYLCDNRSDDIARRDSRGK